MKYVDLSSRIVSQGPDIPEVFRTEIAFVDHKAGAAMIAMFGVKPEHLRDGEGWAVETFTRFGTHNSTHLDAPWHYNSSIGGQPAKTIDELPLDWFHRPGVVVRFTDRADGEAITVADIEAELGRVGHELAPLDIVLVHTGCDRYIDDPDYMSHGPGVTVEATRWLHDAGVRVMGIDAWGWDRPLHLQAADVEREGRAGIFWAAHQADLEYSQIERLVNLEQLPATGFTVCCFPLRLIGGSAAPARVVALVPEDSDV
jgi:kynurenine formamidase